MSEDGMRTERVLLEVTHNEPTPPQKWAWGTRLCSWLRPGESVRVIDESVVAVPQMVNAGNYAGIKWNSCCRQHRAALDKAGIRWAQSTEPSVPENEEAVSGDGDAWGVIEYPGGPIIHATPDEDEATQYAGIVVPLVVQPPARVCLTEEEREAVNWLLNNHGKCVVAKTDSYYRGVVAALLARPSAAM